MLDKVCELFAAQEFLEARRKLQEFRMTVQGEELEETLTVSLTPRVPIHLLQAHRLFAHSAQDLDDRCLSRLGSHTPDENRAFVKEASALAYKLRR